eukprot:2811147-Amphidinium_carterae.1
MAMLLARRPVAQQCRAGLSPGREKVTQHGAPSCMQCKTSSLGGLRLLHRSGSRVRGSPRRYPTLTTSPKRTPES